MSDKVIKPRVLLFNFTSGSGVETTGNVLASMFNDYPDFHIYRNQNPPCLISEAIEEIHPDILIINEFYPRIIQSVYYYKIHNPKSKVIYVNHCYQNLKKFPADSWDLTDGDGSILINRFLQITADHIINLNYHPPTELYPEQLKYKIVDASFPISDEFRITKKWMDRPFDFMYFGGIIPLKFDGEFVKKLSKTNLQIDLYGRWIEKFIGKPDYDVYKKSILDCKNITYKGYIEQDKLIETLNQYKFFVTPHNGPEPFMISLAEATRCGCIPMITNDRNKPSSNWIDWAQDCTLEYSSNDKLIEKMQYYRQIKSQREEMENLDKMSENVSNEMIRRTNFGKFKNLLYRLCFDETVSRRGD